jgi:phosphohistidine phosphatase
VLVVMRHAKAEAVAAEDRDRVLTDRGRRDAAEVGVWLAAQQVTPDYAFVSSAQRTVDTWEAVAHGSGATAEVLLEDALYSGGPETVLEVLRTAPVGAEVVAFIGHNPAAAYVAQLLNDGNPDEAAFREMSEGYPASAVTVIDLAVPWSELDAGTGRIAAFHVGRG